MSSNKIRRQQHNKNIKHFKMLQIEEQQSLHKSEKKKHLFIYNYVDNEKPNKFGLDLYHLWTFRLAKEAKRLKNKNNKNNQLF